MSKKIFVFNSCFITVLIVLVISYFICNSSGCQRSIKSVGSDLGGGLNRTVTVYDYCGNVIKSYTGKFDVSQSENEVYFDLNEQRIIIHGGIVIDEEN